MVNLEGEVWLPVPGFNGYDVSNMGRCRRESLKGLRELKGKLDRIGYRQFGLVRPGGKQEWFLAHRLIASIFLDPSPSPDGQFLTVNHKNRVRHDNRVSNLELVTVTDNHRHWRKFDLINMTQQVEHT